MLDFEIEPGGEQVHGFVIVGYHFTFLWVLKANKE